MLYLSGTTLSGFLLVLLLFKQNRKLSDNILLIWMAIMTFHLGLTSMQLSGLAYEFPHSLGITLSLPLLHGVFLYLYTLSWTRPETIRLRLVMIHLLPFTVLTALAIPFFVLTPDQKISVFQHDGAGFEWYMLIQLPLIIVSGLGYTMGTVREITSQRLSSNSKKMDQRIAVLLQYLAISLGGIWLLSTAFDDAVIFAGVVVFVLMFGCYSVSRVPGLYSQLALEGTSGLAAFGPVLPALPERYVKTGLDGANAAHIMQRVEKLMKSEEMYKRFDLTLDDLAEALQVTPNHLSQAINSVSGRNFYQFINHYRITEFLAIADQEERRKYTFLGLAYDCGFNSKTTFNKYFKQHTGKTPSEYFDRQADMAQGNAFA